MFIDVAGTPVLASRPPKPAPRRRERVAALNAPVVVSAASSTVGRSARSHLADPVWRHNVRTAFNGAVTGTDPTPTEAMFARADALATQMGARLTTHLQLWVDPDGNTVRSGKAAGEGGFRARDGAHRTAATSITADSARNYRTYPSNESGRAANTHFEDLYRVIATAFDPKDRTSATLICADGPSSIFSWGEHLLHSTDAPPRCPTRLRQPDHPS